MRKLLVLALVLSAFTTSARSIQIKNHNLFQKIKLELVADYGNGPESEEHFIYPQMTFYSS